MPATQRVLDTPTERPARSRVRRIMVAIEGGERFTRRRDPWKADLDVAVGSMVADVGASLTGLLLRGLRVFA